MSANAMMGSVSGGGVFDYGTQHTIYAEPQPGYNFATWHDGNTDNPRTVTVTSDASYIAYFVENVGIDETAESSVRVYVSGRNIVVNYDGEEELMLFDISGRRLYRGHDRNIAVRNAGVYMLRIGDRKARKVVVL